MMIKKKKRGALAFLQNLSVISWLVILTIFISVLGFIIFAFFPDYIDYIALKPSNILQGKYLWTLITHMFVHGGVAHLAVNMFVLVSLGRLCERIIGRKRFFWFYILSGLFAGALSVLASGFFGSTILGARIF